MNVVESLVFHSRLLLLPVLLMCLIEFGQIWYFSPNDYGDVIRSGGDGIFRKILWLLALIAILGHFLRCGLLMVARVLLPLLPFVLWCCLSTILWSVDPLFSLKSVVFWAIASLVAASAAIEVDSKLLLRTLGTFFVVVVLCSFALAVVVPQSGFTRYGNELVLRGFFPHKNVFGWFCAIGGILIIANRQYISTRTSLFFILIITLAILAAQSQTSIVAVTAGLLYIFAVRLLKRCFGDGARAFYAMMISLTLAASVVFYLYPFLLDLVGRDTTLTGRTAVWEHYFSYLIHRPVTGLGVGIFSSDTDINLAIGGSVPGFEYQKLHSPHSLYVGLFGEVGFVGLLLFLGGHAYIAIIASFKSNNTWVHCAGALSFLIILAGTAEMRDGIIPGIATIMLIVARGASLRSLFPNAGLYMKNEVA